MILVMIPDLRTKKREETEEIGIDPGGVACGRVVSMYPLLYMTGKAAGSHTPRRV